MANFDEEIDLLEELDNISKIHLLERDDIEKLMLEFSVRIAKTLKIERISAWLYNKEKTAIISIGEYDTRTQVLKKDDVLLRENYPIYFQGITENKIIVAQNIYEHPLTMEFSEVYSPTHQVISLMDIPLRINGELIGVMCFEKTGEKEKKFSVMEKSFAFSVATVFASTLEARKRRALQHKLKKILEEKEMLMKEMNHRISNNLAILISLLRLRHSETNSPDLELFLTDYESRILSIQKIHDLLQMEGRVSEIELASYLEEISNQFKVSYPEFSKFLVFRAEAKNCVIPTKNALHVGLILSEIYLNAAKYSLSNYKNEEFTVKLFHNSEGHCMLEINDPHGKFNFIASLASEKLGCSIIYELASNFGSISEFPTQSSGTYRFQLV